LHEAAKKKQRIAAATEIPFMFNMPSGSAR
jgi:hypothetical protein